MMSHHHQISRHNQKCDSGDAGDVIDRQNSGGGVHQTLSPPVSLSPRRQGHRRNNHRHHNNNGDSRWNSSRSSNATSVNLLPMKNTTTTAAAAALQQQPLLINNGSVVDRVTSSGGDQQQQQRGNDAKMVTEKQPPRQRPQGQRRQIMMNTGGGGEDESHSFWHNRRSMFTTMFISATLLFGTFSFFNAFSSSNAESAGGVDALLGDNDDAITQLISDDDAKGYLNRYGYTGSSMAASQGRGEPRVYAQRKSAEDLVGELTLDTIRTAVRKFQEFAGLPTTGDLDNRTRKKMAQPRCGIQDVQMLTSGEHVMKWRKRRVTYQLTHSTSDIPEHMQKQALQMAFDTWAKIVPLDFAEASRRDTPDVKVLFARRSHSDPWPFDGRGGVLAHATFPQDGKLHFDDDENWVFMDGRKIANHRFTDLFWVALHEIGHVLGLSHSNIETAIMAPFYQDPRDMVDWRGNYKRPELTTDDVHAAQQIYGKRYARLDSAAVSGTSAAADRSGGARPKGGGGTYDDRRDGSLWSRIGKFFSSSAEDDNGANRNNNNNNNNDDRYSHGRQNRNHAGRDRHHRHNSEKEYGNGQSNAAMSHLHIANMLFIAMIFVSLITPKLALF